MTEIINMITNETLSISTITSRFILSFILGAVIGLDREIKKQPAGLRTHILICTGSTLIMLMSLSFNQEGIRIAAQVVSGIGFIGGGAILRLGTNVRGLTTASSIWVAAGIGLASGAGRFYIALLGSGIIIFTLVFVDLIEKQLFPNRFLKILKLHLKSSNFSSEIPAAILLKYGIKIKNIEIAQEADEKEILMNFHILIPNNTELEKLYEELRSIHEVYKVKIEQGK